MLQRHYPVPVVVLCKICKIPLYSCSRLLIRSKRWPARKGLSFGKRRTCNFTWMLMTDYQLRKINLADIIAIYGRGRELFRQPTYTNIQNTVVPASGVWRTSCLDSGIFWFSYTLESHHLLECRMIQREEWPPTCHPLLSTYFCHERVHLAPALPSKHFPIRIST